RGIYSAGFSPRQMGNGGNRLNYELYTGPAHTTIWGDGSSATAFISDTLSVLPGGASRDHIVYGRIPARQTSAAVGGYSDSITITVNYQ
ncbi:MAG TPA: spore coat protein U domain-containing protein, partial [Gallionellaceae bacterium]